MVSLRSMETTLVVEDAAWEAAGHMVWDTNAFFATVSTVCHGREEPDRFARAGSVAPEAGTSCGKAGFMSENTFNCVADLSYVEFAGSGDCVNGIVGKSQRAGAPAVPIERLKLPFRLRAVRRAGSLRA